MTGRDKSGKGMSGAQLATLRVLAARRGSYVRGGKRSSALEPVPTVNTRAATALCRLGFARAAMLSWANVFTSSFEYQITQEGLAVLAQDESSGSTATASGVVAEKRGGSK